MLIVVVFFMWICDVSMTKLKMRRLIDVEGKKDVDQTDAVVGCKKVLDQKELDVIEANDVLALLEVVGRCLEGIEDVLANPNDVEYDVLMLIL